LVSTAGGTPTIYVTGHSLGGAVTSVLSLYLAKVVQWSTQPIFQVYTFAAPAAGLTDFATLCTQTFPNVQSGKNSGWRVYNVWDVVPQVWTESTMSAMKSWYSWGPEATAEVKYGIDQAIKRITTTSGSYIPYTQPYLTNTTNTIALNQIQKGSTYPPQYDPNYLQSTTADFVGQLGFQHANNTYLALLNAPAVVPVPAMPTKLNANPVLFSKTKLKLSWDAPRARARSAPAPANTMRFPALWASLKNRGHQRVVSGMCLYEIDDGRSVERDPRCACQGSIQTHQPCSSHSPRNRST
jgi:hypothetical protein